MLKHALLSLALAAGVAAQFGGPRPPGPAPPPRIDPERPPGFFPQLPKLPQGLEVARARVSLPEGAGIRDTIAALAAAIDGAVVADVAVKERRLSAALADAPLGEALNRISVDFDRHWVLRGNTIALQLRYSDPEEPAALELEELLQAATDMDRAMGRLPTDQLIGDGFPRARAAFFRSVTPTQQEAMINGGVMLPDLPQRQRRALAHINVISVYGSAARETRRGLNILRNLDSCVIAEVTSVGPAYSKLLLWRPDPATGERPDDASLSWLAQAPREEAPAPHSTGEVLVSTASPGPAWRVRPTEMSLEQFSSSWKQAIGSPLRIPSYAATRKLLVCSAGATRSAVAQSVADLWGWDSSSVADGRRLDRPAPPAVRDAAEIPLQLLRAVPPAMRNGAVAFGEFHDHRRRFSQSRGILTAVRQLGRPGPETYIKARVRVDQLDAEARRVIANIVLEIAAGDCLNSGVTPDKWPLFLTQPERTYIRLSGPLSTDSPPGFFIGVRGSGGGVVGWGSTARLKWPPEKRQ